MKHTGQMDTVKVSYKAIDPRCDVKVRELNRHRAVRRLITANKKKAASAGLIVKAPEDFYAGALVEIDLSFPGIPMIYRSRGIVDWVDPADSPNKEDKMGVLIFGMDKLDPNAAPASIAPKPPAPPSAPAAAPAPQPAPPQESEPEPEPEPEPETPSTPEPEPEHPIEEPPAEEQPETQKEIGPGLIMPDLEDVAELFSGLVDAEVEVTVNTENPLVQEHFAAVGDYITDDNETVFIMAADLSLANYLGSALVMLPQEEAENAINAQQLTEEIRESFQEIFNISASLLNVSGNPHLRFGQLYLPSDTPLNGKPNEIASHPTAKLDLSINVPGYGAGRLCLMDSTTSEK